MLKAMLHNSFPEQAVVNEWKSQILETLSENLHKEGFTDDQIRKVARAVWAALNL